MRYLRFGRWLADMLALSGQQSGSQTGSQTNLTGIGAVYFEEVRRHPCNSLSALMQQTGKSPSSVRTCTGLVRRGSLYWRPMAPPWDVTTLEKMVIFACH